MFPTLYKQHTQTPKNTGRLENFTHFGEAENPVCGDETEFFMTIQDGKFIKLQHLTKGCAGSIACASYLSEIITGKNVSDVKIADLKNTILKDLELSSTKKHCVDLVGKALQNALIKD
ncbi:MAG: iron-sulfur cluster assembly scaffold protein [Calditrichaeota bacterium]|nr:MAG: iron-sulfur cluster assembly scaffold protein [Calditrichota bacterium]